MGGEKAFIRILRYRKRRGQNDLRGEVKEKFLKNFNNQFLE